MLGATHSSIPKEGLSELLGEAAGLEPDGLVNEACKGISRSTDLGPQGLVGGAKKGQID